MATKAFQRDLSHLDGLSSGAKEEDWVFRKMLAPIRSLKTTMDIDKLRDALIEGSNIKA